MDKPGTNYHRWSCGKCGMYRPEHGACPHCGAGENKRVDNADDWPPWMRELLDDERRKP